MRPILLLLACLPALLAGCPQGEQQPETGTQQPTADKFADFGNLLRDQRGFSDELKRLQGLYTTAPQAGYAAPANQDSRYKLSSHIVPGGVALALTEADSDEQWLLWAWRDSSDNPPEVTVVNDKATTGGYLLEFNVAGQALAISLTASWTQGRYLQVSRELLLGGLDQDIRVPEGYSEWELDGPWLPYRMVPAPRGPYGVVSDSLADGSWQAVNYPAEAMVPAVATYDKQRGFLLAAVDEHPRILDRDYQLGWRVAPDYSAGGQLRLGYRPYDNTQDAYAPAFLPSGYPLHDTIALEPLELRSSSIDRTLVYAQTSEVIALTGQLVRAYHFAPNPPPPLADGGFIDAAAWVSDLSEMPDFLRQSTGIWEVKYAAARIFDGALMAGGNIGLGAGELPGGAGVNSQAIAALDQIDPTLLPVLAQLDFLAFTRDDAYAKAYPQWLAVDSEGQRFTAKRAGGEDLGLDIRNPQVAAWVTRKMSTDLADCPQVAGYLFNSMYIPAGAPQDQAQGPFYVAWPAAAAAICLRTAEEVRGARPEALLVGCPKLSLALPAFCNGYLNGAASYLSPDPQQAELLPHANRLSNEVVQQVFGVRPLVSFSRASLADQVIATTGAVGGHTLTKGLADYPGFPAFAENQRELREAGGELAVIFSSPAQSAYAIDGERPADCSAMIAALPAKWDDAATIWIAFHGTGGSVAVDTLNNVTVSWPGGSWRGRLPGGYWVIEHPDPTNVPPGDAVLVIKKPIGYAPGSRGAAS